MTAELMTRAQAGDLDAFAQLYAQHYPDVLAYARKRHPQQAEDIAQDTFVRALASLHQWRDMGRTPGAWLTTIAANLCRDRAKSYAHRHVVARDLLDPDWAGPNHCEPVEMRPGPEDVAVLLAETSRALAAMRQLRLSHREALVLRYLRQMSTEEVAERMGVTVSAAKALLFRARQAMAKLLGEVADA